MRVICSLLVACAAFPVLAAEPDCSGAVEKAEAASAALKSCLGLGLGDCEAEQKAADEATSALEGCRAGATTPDAAATPAASATPASGMTEPVATATPAATPEPAGKIAVLVEGVTGAELDAANAGARLGLASATLVEASAIRAARAFLPAGPLDDAAAAKLRTDVGAERLLIIQIKPDGATRFILVKVLDPGGANQRFGEATAKTLGDEVKKLVTDLPSVAPLVVATPTPAPTPAPTPQPVVIMMPTPAPTPWQAPQYEPWRPYIDVNVFAGNKNLSNEDWAPVASQTELGVAGTFGGAGWPILFASDFYYSFASGEARGVPVSATVAESAFGLRAVFEVESFRPHIGAGMVYATTTTTAEFEDSTEVALGFGTGFWVGAGANLRIGRSANVGAAVRFSSVTAEVPVYATSTAAGGFHAGITLGFGFGAAAGARAPRDPSYE